MSKNLDALDKFLVDLKERLDNYIESPGNNKVDLIRDEAFMCLVEMLERKQIRHYHDLVVEKFNARWMVSLDVMLPTIHGDEGWQQVCVALGKAHSALTLNSLYLKAKQLIKQGKGMHLVAYPGTGGDIFVEKMYAEEVNGWHTLVLCDREEQNITKRKRWMDDPDIPTPKEWEDVQDQLEQMKVLYETGVKKVERLESCINVLPSSVTSININESYGNSSYLAEMSMAAFITTSQAHRVMDLVQKDRDKRAGLTSTPAPASKEYAKIDPKSVTSWEKFQNDASDYADLVIKAHIHKNKLPSVISQLGEENEVKTMVSTPPDQQSQLPEWMKNAVLRKPKSDKDLRGINTDKFFSGPLGISYNMHQACPCKNSVTVFVDERTCCKQCGEPYSKVSLSYSAMEDAVVVLRAKLLETQSEALVDGLLLQPLQEVIGEGWFEALVDRTERVVNKTTVQLPDRSGMASMEHIHLKPAPGHGVQTIYFCGGALTESNPPPNTFNPKVTTCLHCIAGYETWVDE